MDIEQAREIINETDDKIAELFRRRMDAALEIARYKQSHDMPVLDRARERAIIERVCEKTGGQLAPYTEQLFNTLFEQSRAYQSAYLAANGKD